MKYAVLVVVDTSIMPVATYPSHLTKCADCERDCWIGDRSTQSALEQGITLVPKCVTCSGVTYEQLMLGRRVFDKEDQ